MDIPRSWIAFIYALPANAIVMLSLCSAWKEHRWSELFVSVIAWGGLISLYATLKLFFQADIWKLFLLGIPGQLAIYFAFRVTRPFRNPFKKQIKEDNHG